MKRVPFDYGEWFEGYLHTYWYYQLSGRVVSLKNPCKKLKGTFFNFSCHLGQPDP